jgi:UDP-N-acetyl-2-amino-2-deoxyglucuronate dehydrogenase
MADKIRFGILGCGRIAQRHALHAANTGKLIAVCDVVPEKALELAAIYEAAAFNDVKGFMAENVGKIDVISICTPNGLHAEHSIMALNMGYHVLCEKPMAISVSDCRRMIDAATNTENKLFIIKQNRYNPPVAAVKKILAEGQLGRIYSIQLNCFWNRNNDYYANSWKGTREWDGGTLFTQFSHFVDLLYWFFGDVEDVHAMGANYHHNEVIEFEDTGVVLLKFKNGAIGSINYTVNAFAKNMEGSLTLFAENGTIKIGGQYLNELEYQSMSIPEITNLPKGNTPNNYGSYQGSMSNHDKVYQNVSDVLNYGAEMATDMYEGLKTVEIIERIYQEMQA